jgi:pteridine reductase
MLALVTGGLTRLGAAIAARLAADGFDLALHGRNEGHPTPALSEAIAGHGIAWSSFAVDLSDTAAPEQLMSAVMHHFGRGPDLLINSAAMFEEGNWSELTRAQLDRHMAVNFTAPVMMTQAAARYGCQVAINLLDQRILNPPLDQAAYTASKLALGATTRLMARAFAPMRVNAVAPGLTIPGDDYDGEQIGRLADMMPLRRLPTPEQVAEAVAYLARAEAVTGQIMFVDGGAALESYARDFVHLARE